MPRITDKDRQGLIGSVETVWTEVAEWDKKDEEWIVGPKWLLKASTFDRNGKLIDEPIYNYGSYFTNNVFEDSTPMGLGLYIERRRNDEDQVVESLLHNREGIVLMESRYEYDEAGNKRGAKEYRTDGTLIMVHDYFFDENGKPTRETLQIPSDKDCERNWFYNDQGVLIRETESCSNGIGEETHYSYEEIDSMGNWTKSNTVTAYYREGNLVGEGRKTYFRRIKYYQ